MFFVKQNTTKKLIKQLERLMEKQRSLYRRNLQIQWVKNRIVLSILEQGSHDKNSGSCKDCFQHLNVINFDNPTSTHTLNIFEITSLMCFYLD